MKLMEAVELYFSHVAFSKNKSAENICSIHCYLFIYLEKMEYKGYSYVMQVSHVYATYTAVFKWERRGNVKFSKDTP